MPVEPQSHMNGLIKNLPPTQPTAETLRHQRQRDSAWRSSSRGGSARDPELIGELYNLQHGATFGVGARWWATASLGGGIEETFWWCIWREFGMAKNQLNTLWVGFPVRRQSI